MQPSTRNTWTTFEKRRLGTFLIVIICITGIFSRTGTDRNDRHSILLNWGIAPISAITGIITVVLAAKGNTRNYMRGTVNCLTYGYIAYISGYYGDMLLNRVYFLPFQLIGFLWRKNHLIRGSDVIVTMKKLSPKQWWFRGSITAISVGIFGYLLHFVDSRITLAMKRSASIYITIDKAFGIPYLGELFDASTEAFQIIAQILMTFAYAEQRLFWILTNIITIIMWSAVLIVDPTSVARALPTLIMRIAFLINSFYGYHLRKKNAH